ncbi:MAG: NAD(P)/FAD-dependent oxidoreductase [Clostridia bacterium]
MLNYDVAVIGAGNGGLAAATTMAMNGKKVIVFEKHNIPGGCGTSFRRGRFEFEVALHQLSSMGTVEKPGPLRKLFEEYGILDKIEWVPIESLFSINLPNGKRVPLPANRKGAEDALIEAFPEEKEGVLKYFETVYKFVEESDEFAAKSAKSTGEPSSLKKAIMKVGFPKIYPTLAKYAVRSTDEVLAEFFKGKEIQLCLSAYWCFMGVPPEKFPFTILAKCSHIYIEDKPYYLRGGSQMISQALTETIRKHGGEVVFNNGVKKIVVKNGVAVGVVDSNDVEYSAKQIISNISPNLTYNKLIDKKDLPNGVIDYFRNYDVGISALTCFIGLDCPPEEVGFKDSFNLTYHSLNANEDFKNAYTLGTEVDPIITTCYTVDDKGGYPEGTSVVTAGTLKYSAPWEKLTPEEYYEAKYAAANTIIDRLEKIYPGFRSHIEEIEVATPLTHMRYLGHPGGSIYGYEQNLKSSVFFFPQQVFIENLDFASGWVNTCGFGPNYMYGDKIAHKLLNEVK